MSALLTDKFTTIGTTGLPTTLAGTPALSVYKDGSTTESTAGVTLTVDFDSRTGMNHWVVDTSADGTFYSAGSNFQVVITTGTVGGVSVVGYVVGSFSIENRNNKADLQTIKTQSVTLTGALDLDDLVADVDATETRVVLALPAAAPQAAGGLVTSTAGSLDFDDLAADIDATETRVILALPAAAPNAAGGLLITSAGTLDMDDLAADVDAVETRVTTALPNAAPNAAGGLLITTAGTLDMDDLAADVDGIETTVNSISSQATAIKAKTDNLPAAPAATGDAMALTTGERTSLIAALFASISEGTETFIQSFRLMRAGAAGKLSGAATTSVKLRNAADTKDRIAATVDADGNRTAVTTDGT